MNTHDPAVTGTGGEAELRRFRRFALFAGFYTYALIIFGGIVRITDSGMGCGDDWPKCHGVWIPTFTLETFIEWMHRLLAAGIGLVIVAVAAYAFVNRRRPGFGGPGGVLRPMLLLIGLLVFQGLLGAATVKLELPWYTSAAHFITAMIFFAVLIVAVVRAGTPAADERSSDAASAAKAWRSAASAAVLGLIVVSFGGITANMLGAPQACQGFPLCNGQLLPAPVAEVHVHWSHRLFAFLLFFHVLGATMAVLRRGAPTGVKRAAVATLALVVAQIIVAAGLVMMYLPRDMQALHLVVGVAIWCALVTWAALARRWANAAAATPAEPGFVRA